MSKIKPFCVDMKKSSAYELNKLLSLAVDVGAKAFESVYDDHNDIQYLQKRFLNFSQEEIQFYDKDSFEFVGVSAGNRTYVASSTHEFEGNLLDYNEAKEVLESLLQSSKETEQVNTSNQVHTSKLLKSFYVKLDEVYHDAMAVNSLLKRFVALGAVQLELGYDFELPESQVRGEEGDAPINIVPVPEFNLFGLKRKEGRFVTYINDYPHEWDAYAVAMTLKEAEDFAKSLEEAVEVKRSPKVKKKPKLRQRKVTITYINDKQYVLKNVIGLDVKQNEKYVAVTYNLKKGKVSFNVNVRIPFSELKSVKFQAPNTIGAEYIFKNDKVVNVVQDFTREAFTHKSH